MVMDCFTMSQTFNHYTEELKLMQLHVNYTSRKEIIGKLKFLITFT